MTQLELIALFRTLVGPLQVFAIPLAWTTFFSLFTRRPLRGLRNFGIIASYLVSLVALLRFGWRPTLLAWAFLGLLSGTLYFAYEVASHLRARAQREGRPSLATVLHGLVAWPIMAPEAIESILSAMGLLGTSRQNARPIKDGR
jgi:hypothetical protein